MGVISQYFQERRSKMNAVNVTISGQDKDATGLVTQLVNGVLVASGFTDIDVTATSPIGTEDVSPDSLFALATARNPNIFATPVTLVEIYTGPDTDLIEAAPEIGPDATTTDLEEVVVPDEVELVD